MVGERAWARQERHTGHVPGAQLARGRKTWHSNSSLCRLLLCCPYMSVSHEENISQALRPPLYNGHIHSM